MTPGEISRRLRAYHDRTPDYHRPDLPAPPPWDRNDRAIRGHVRPGDRLLDLGGGAGRLRPRLPAGRYVVADESHEALRQGGQGVLAEATRLPFPDGAFDVVFCHHALEHFAEPEAALGEAVRVLAPGGRLLLCGPAFDSPRQPLPMVSHWPPGRRLALRARLLLRLLRNEAVHAVGRFRYRPLVLEDVASLRGLGPAGDDYDAVHPTQLHETVFWLESRGLELVELARRDEHRGPRPRPLAPLLARLPFLRWLVRSFPLVARKPLTAARPPLGLC